nr:hypothetical protein [Tanacetum cinerariifolium]
DQRRRQDRRRLRVADPEARPVPARHRPGNLWRRAAASVRGGHGLPQPGRKPCQRGSREHEPRDPRRRPAADRLAQGADRHQRARPPGPGAAAADRAGVHWRRRPE